MYGSMRSDHVWSHDVVDASEANRRWDLAQVYCPNGDSFDQPWKPWYLALRKATAVILKGR